MLLCRDGGSFFAKLDRPDPFWQDNRPSMLAMEDPRDPTNDLGKGSYNFDRLIRPALDFAYQQLSAPSRADESILARIVRYSSLNSGQLCQGVLRLHQPLPCSHEHPAGLDSKLKSEALCILHLCSDKAILLNQCCCRQDTILLGRQLAAPTEPEAPQPSRSRVQGQHEQPAMAGHKRRGSDGAQPASKKHRGASQRSACCTCVTARRRQLSLAAGKLLSGHKPLRSTASVLALAAGLTAAEGCSGWHRSWLLALKPPATLSDHAVQVAAATAIAQSPSMWRAQVCTSVYWPMFAACQGPGSAVLWITVRSASRSQDA